MKTTDQKYDVLIQRDISCTTTGSVIAPNDEAAKQRASAGDLDDANVSVKHSKILNVKSAAEDIQTSKFYLRFERYAQEVAYSEVEAKDLNEVILRSKFIDMDELDWEIEDTDPTTPRLYGVKDEEETWVAEVDLSRVLGVPCWTHEDLRRQWKIAQVEEIISG